MTKRLWTQWVSRGHLFSLTFAGMLGSRMCDWPAPVDGPPDPSETGVNSTTSDDATASDAATVSGDAGFTSDTDTVSATSASGYPSTRDADSDAGPWDPTVGTDSGLPCTSHCPLRVDTQLTTAGDGSSWETALNDLQLAIDIQAARAAEKSGCVVAS